MWQSHLNPAPGYSLDFPAHANRQQEEVAIGCYIVAWFSRRYSQPYVSSNVYNIYYLPKVPQETQNGTCPKQFKSTYQTNFPLGDARVSPGIEISTSYVSTNKKLETLKADYLG